MTENISPSSYMKGNFISREITFCQLILSADSPDWPVVNLAGKQRNTILKSFPAPTSLLVSRKDEHAVYNDIRTFILNKHRIKKELEEVCGHLKSFTFVACCICCTHNKKIVTSENEMIK